MGFEPTHDGFAIRCLNPLGYAAGMSKSFLHSVLRSDSFVPVRSVRHGARPPGCREDLDGPLYVLSRGMSTVQLRLGGDCGVVIAGGGASSEDEAGADKAARPGARVDCAVTPGQENTAGEV